MSRPAGWHHTPEARAKIGAANKGERNPMKRPEVRAARLGKPGPMLGRHHTPEAREKISAAQRGRPSPHTGHPCSPEAREKLRQANLGRHHTPETRAKVGAAKRGNIPWNKGKPLSPECREKLAAAQQAIWSRPGQRERISGPNASNWRGGVSFEPYCPKFSKEFKERVRAFWEYRCGLCGKAQMENGRALSIHHVHYRKEACCDDEVPRYFIPLCPSCHSKTGKDRGHWQKVIVGEIDRRFNGRCYLPKLDGGI